MTHSLTLGNLLLTDSFPDTDNDFKFDVLADGVGFGVAAGVKEVITSLLSDGDLIRTTRYGNREVSFVVEITGPDLASLAHGEAALRREIGGGNTLTWQPPDDFAVASVFEVVDSEMSQKFDDLDELGKRRQFTLTLTCSPFARSANMVTVEALAVGPTPTTVSVSTADATTGWSTVAPATLGQTGGYVYCTMTSAYGSGGEGAHYLFFAAATNPATPYVVVEWQATLPVSFTPTLLAAPVVQTMNLPDGWTRTVYDTTGLSYGALTFRAVPLGTTGQYRIRDVKRTNVPPSVSPRQVSRIIEVGGTERTPASIHVEATTGGDGHNGLVIVHTAPEDGSGYSPSLRRWRTSASTGPVITDATTLSGGREPIAFAAGGFVAEVPTSALPEGGYVLMARMRMASGPVTVGLSWSTSTIFPGSTGQQGYTNGSVKVPFNNTAWRIVPVAVLSLPSVRTKSGKVQIVFQVPTTDHAQVEIDEGWLFRADDDCALTIVTTFQPHLWLDSPDVTSSVPRIWTGDERSLQVHPGEALQAMGNHVLHPDGTAVFTASLSDNPATEATFYRRWPNNAAS